jgi:small subunit ribosomal protein S20
MANNPSARKRYRQSLKRRERNKHALSTVRNAVRKVRAAAGGGEGDPGALVRSAERLLRKAGSKGVLHHKTVDRTVSRLQRLVQRSG